VENFSISQRLRVLLLGQLEIDLVPFPTMETARKLIAALLVGVFVASGCGSNSLQTDGADSGVDPADASTDSSEKKSGDIEVDEGLLSTEIRLPLDLFTSGTEGEVTTPTESELQASVDADGYDIDVKVNSDNTVTYRMSRREYDRFKNNLKQSVDESIQEAINNESNVYKSVTYSDDLREFKVLVDRAEYENSFSFFSFSILITASFYQAFSGVESSDRFVVINYIDENTNEIFDTYDSREEEN
jgi:hypothetical protein